MLSATTIKGNKITRWGARAYWVWVIAAFGVPYQFILQSSTSVMVPNLERAFHTDAAGIGLIASVFFYTYLTLQIPAGLFVDRFGARKLLASAMAIGALTTLMFSQAHTFASAEITRILMGIVAAPSVAGALYIVANWFELRVFATIAGLSETMGMTGGAVGQIVLAHSVSSVGWRTSLVGLAVFGLVMMVLVWCVVRDHPRHIKSSAIQVASQPTVVEGSLWSRFLVLMHCPQVWLNGIFCGLSFACLSTLGGLWAVPFLQTAYHLTLVKAAIGSACIYFGAALGCPVLGGISDHIGKRKPCMWWGAIANLCSLVVLVFYTGLPVYGVYAVMLIVGFTASIYVLPFAIVREITCHSMRGTAMAFTNTWCILIGAPLLQPLVGWVLRYFGPEKIVNHAPYYALNHYQMALSSLLVCAVAALIVLVFIKETHCQERIQA